ncbi:MAG: 50S ribosomal protein L13 [candidate division FCPU426 bacterium]
MPELTKQTKSFSTREALADRKWFVVDATGQPLGRISSRIAHVLKGKHKTIYQPHIDMGDNVIVLNAEKVKITGRKLTEKIAFRHSLYPGGARYVRYDALMKTKPEKAIDLAVKGMLPKSALGRRMRDKLYIYKGTTHPHKAQKPAEFPNVIVKL